MHDSDVSLNYYCWELGITLSGMLATVINYKNAQTLNLETKLNWTQSAIDVVVEWAGGFE